MEKAYGIRGWLKIGAYGVVAAGGVFVLTDNLSTAIIVMAITVLLLFLVHPKTKRFVVFACVVLVLAVIVVVYLKIQISDMATSTDFRMRRIIAWLNPEEIQTRTVISSFRAYMQSDQVDFSGKVSGTVPRN